MHHKLLPLFALLLALLFASPLGAQNTVDLIRGKVQTVDSIPVRGARVTVVSLETQTSRVTATDSAGRYTVVFHGGEGDYLVSYHMIGFVPVVRQVKRLHDEDVLVSDVVMEATPLQLESQIIIARLLPERGTGDLPDSTGTWEQINGIGVGLNDQGNLALMAAMLPGVNLVTDDDGNPTGITVLGMGADQNVVTVDGVQQNIGNVPTEGMPQARVTTTTSDPSRGGFSGASVQVQSKPGSWQVSRSLGLTVDEPNMQWSDRVGTQLGREYTNLQLSGQSSGPVVRDRLFFRGSFQLGRRFSDRYTVLNAGERAFNELGASIDSVARLRSVMNELGIPVTTPAVPSNQLTQNGSFMLRTDLTPAGTHAINATLNGSWRNQASSATPLTAPARGGETETMNVSGQLNHSVYLPLGILSETKLAHSKDNNESAAYLQLPDARVRIRSEGIGSGASVANFQLGGNSSMPTRTRNTKWELTNMLSWVSAGNAHRVKLGIELKFDEFSQTQATNRFGTFTFNSLADFEEGKPSEFRRQLTEVQRGADLFTAAFSLGDQWRKTKNLNLQYGIRVETDHYGARPTLNPDVVRVFGVRNDHAPNAVHVIPRFGFTWSYGTAPQIAAFEGAARGPKATLKGTIGQYRNTPRNSLLQPAMGSTGLPNGIQILTCRGEAVPAPDWHAYAEDVANIPDRCLDGTGSSVFADRQPNVLLFSPGFEAERSWRADLEWSGTALRRYRLAVGGLVSLNNSQTANVDINFRNSPAFTLASENDRPVFVAAKNISSRGSLATRDARVSSEFSKVTERRSDLQSAAAQFKLSLSPVVVAPRAVRWSFNYVNMHATQFTRGFGGTSGRDPMRRTWGPSKNPVHQIDASANYSIFGFKLGLSARVTSGVRYTPMVRGDINGDGESNDRAYIFDPAVASDTAVANAMQSLLLHGPSTVRRCLRSQIGRIAGVNSCEGPWSAVLNLSLSLDPMKFAVPGRTTLSASFGNPMSGIDLLLNGNGGKPQWGQSHNNPDPTLLYVRGFDQNTRSFRYAVNADFGGTRASRATQGQPFLITLRFSTDLSPPMDKQNLRRQVDGWQRGTINRPSETSLRRQYTQRFTSMFESIMKQKDTLRLTPEQADSISGMNAGYAAQIDSLWRPHARYVLSLGDAYDLNEVYSRALTLQRLSYDLLAAHARAVRAVLTSEQFNRLPQSYGVYFDEKQLRKLR